MKPIQAAHYIAKVLEQEEQAKLVILSGSAARGKEKPNDLDIAAVFPHGNKILEYSYRVELKHRLRQEIKEKVYGLEFAVVDDIDFFAYNEKYIDDLVQQYRENPLQLCFYLGVECQDSVRNQWKGWPLAWIMGEQAKERLSPYGCFQNEYLVLAGQEYLEELKRRINKLVPVITPPKKKNSLRYLLGL